MTIRVTRYPNQMGLSLGSVRSLAAADEAAAIADGWAVVGTLANAPGDDIAVRYDPTSRTIVDPNGASLTGTPEQAAANAALVSDAWKAAAISTSGATTAQRPSAALMLLRYRAAVVAAGGTPLQSQLDALEPILAEMIADSSDPWSVIAEMHVPMGADGDLAGALVKLLPGLNNSGGRTWALTNNGPLVSGDYTAAGGIDPGAGNTTKYLDSDVRISNTLNNFVLSPSIGLGMLAVSLRPNTTGRIMGLTNNGNAYLMDSSVGNSQGLNGQANGPGQVERGIYGMESYSLDGVNQVAVPILNGAASRALSAAGVTTSVGTSGVRVFKADVSSTSNNTYGGYVLYRAPALPAQRRAIARFLRRASDALGRPIYGDGTNAKCLVIAGDSIDSNTSSFSAGVTLGQDWTSLTAAGLGLSRHVSQDTTVSGCAVGGRGLVGSQTASGIWGDVAANVAGRTYQQIGLTRLGRVTIIKLGVNDNLQGSDATRYASVLDTVVSDYLATGIDPAQLWLATPPIRSGFVGSGASTGRNYSTAAPYAAAIRATAAKYGCPVVPFYEHTRVKDTLSTSWDFDGVGVHPEADIHAIMGDLALTYGTMTPARTW